MQSTYTVSFVQLWNRCARTRGVSTVACLLAPCRRPLKASQRQQSAAHRMQQQCLHAAHGWVACSLACSLHPRSTLDRCGCRADGSVDRLTYFEIRVGDTPATDDPTANALCASYDSPAQSVYTFACSSPTPGRYLVVRLRPVDYSLRTDTILTLCEVQAYGAAPPPPPR